MTATGKMRLQRLDTIGNPSAESDEAFLYSCFVDNGHLDLLRDCAHQQSIVLGRTGAGKTALLKKLLEYEERSVALDIQNLALGYISNSTILTFFEALNIKMDTFYRFLWRHVFMVEILKAHFELDSEEKKTTLLDRIALRLQGKKRYLDAFEYLNTWGTSFWTTTEERIKEVTQKVEYDLRAKAAVGVQDVISLGAEGSYHLTEEQRREFTQRGQEVINNIQMSKLTLLFEALDKAILTDPQKRYYIVVDQLDEDWVDDTRRYRLIRALIETMRDINQKVKQVKVIIALRTDLFQRVLQATRDAGFQDEKYQGLALPVTWDRAALVDLLDLRIDQLFRPRYQRSQRVTHQDLLPPAIGKKKEPAIAYLLDRTLLRPRDMITFFNLCLEAADGQTSIAPRMLLQAEGQYSQRRLVSLADEWSVQYPYLVQLAAVLKGRSECFALSEIDESTLSELCLEVLTQEPLKPGKEVERLQAYFDGKLSASTLRACIAQILHQVGMIGLKTEAFKAVTWSPDGRASITLAEITDQAQVQVHKMLWRALGIVPAGTSSNGSVTLNQYAEMLPT